MAKARDNVLPKLFGSGARVRLLRLFLLNPKEVFDLALLVKRTHISREVVKKELLMLLDICYIHRQKKPAGFILNRDFHYLNELAALLASSAPLAREKLSSTMRGAGKVSLLVIAGSLLGEERDHVDLFIVGEALKKSRIERVLGRLESEIGRELVYAMMPTKEFEYRYGMQDRFIKDLFGKPHELLINKLNILGR